MIEKIASLLNLEEKRVQKAVELLDEGNTIPFIARYRKELTGNLEDQELRDIQNNLTRLRNLEERRKEIIKLIDKEGQLTDSLKEKLEYADSLKDLEDLYLPYKKKRRTRATIAKEKGYEGLSDFILAWHKGDPKIVDTAVDFAAKAEESPEEAIKGALDIIAERVSETSDFRDILRKDAREYGILEVRAKEGEDFDSKYEMYADFSESLSDLPAHRILAINRGEKEGFLKVNIKLTDDGNIERIVNSLVASFSLDSFPYVYEAVSDSYKRLLFPSIENELRKDLTERAEASSIEVFAKNLRPYLMQSPIKKTVVMGVDPGFRTGCKLAVVSEYGDFLENATIYPTQPHNKVEEAVALMRKLILKYKVGLIAIGNGTASRETEGVVADMLAEYAEDFKGEVFYTIVSESGASIYSASEVGIDEFPDLDVTVRGAISIARRIQDPLSELVKIEPKHIGVGQYQHDINQKNLNESLSQVVEACVNGVGVYVNSASVSLLKYVSGISENIAKNILTYKEEHGPFKNRREFLKVKGLGPKAFEQAAGFLRIEDGDNPLDNTAVHPESYDIAKAIKDNYRNIDLEEKSKELEVGILTLKDIVDELKRPGRDPREDMPKPILRKDVLSIDDLKEGMILNGTVRNVVDFGCFVDIGIKNDGLVHISELSDRFVKNPSDVVEVSDLVKVRIIGIDKDRKRVSLSMKNIN